MQIKCDYLVLTIIRQSIQIECPYFVNGNRWSYNSLHEWKHLNLCWVADFNLNHLHLNIIHQLPCRFSWSHSNYFTYNLRTLLFKTSWRQSERPQWKFTFIKEWKHQSLTYRINRIGKEKTTRKSKQKPMNIFLFIFLLKTSIDVLFFIKTCINDI